jgi:hypothetical protein
MDSKDKLFKSN